MRTGQKVTKSQNLSLMEPFRDHEYPLFVEGKLVLFKTREEFEEALKKVEPKNEE